MTASNETKHTLVFARQAISVMRFSVRRTYGKGGGQKQKEGQQTSQRWFCNEGEKCSCQLQSVCKRNQTTPARASLIFTSQATRATSPLTRAHLEDGPLTLLCQFRIDARDSDNSLPAVSSRLLKWLAVVILTFVLGGHWAILQSVAWMTMVAGYSQIDPLKQALVKTFDGKHPCPLCKFVAKGKKSEQKQATQKLLTKLDFFLATSPVGLFPPARDPLQFAPLCSAGALGETPPTPPPRYLPG